MINTGAHVWVSDDEETWHKVVYIAEEEGWHIVYFGLACSTGRVPFKYVSETDPT